MCRAPSWRSSQGAGAVLDACLGLEIEVEFTALYQHQPLFADVDRFLRARGFVLWRLSQLVHYSERPLPGLTRSETQFYSDIPTLMTAGAGRLFWGHAVYFRDYQALEHSRAGVRSALVLAALLDAADEQYGCEACLRHLHSVLHPWLSAEQRQALAETLGARS
jgi:hypothetical protein